MSEPWKDWIPGVLSKSQVKELCTSDFIRGVEDPKIDHSSIDLHLKDEAYHMVGGSVKPFGPRYEQILKEEEFAEHQEQDEDGGFTLNAKNTYVFELHENIGYLREAKIYGQATAKSSVGRVDVLAPLIVDGMNCYERFDPSGLKDSSGQMYLEITPITFNIRVREGIRLSQLRLFYGRPEISEIAGEELYESSLSNRHERDGSLSVDLLEAIISGEKVSAFCAKEMEEGEEPIDLDALKEEEEAKKLSPCKYWRFLRKDEHDRLKIEKGNFYIMRSKERISLPKGIAVYCRAIDETIGEMRIHYAGFVHPFFGNNREDGKIGTPLIFEVRGHDVNVILRHKEKMANLTFYRMSQDCEPEDSKPTAYSEQELDLSKIFQDWPPKLKVEEDGTVQEVIKGD